MSDRPKVGIVLVSHSAALAEGTAELAGQIAGGTVIIATAGGTEDGRIGTSVDKVERALALADAGAGVVILPDLGSSVLTVRALLAEPSQRPGPIAVADAPFVEGAVAATVTATAGGDVEAVLRAAEEARHARKL
jgi:phosphoenolpyruvate---glycerone phosphotransferase subunit DhaM